MQRFYGNLANGTAQNPITKAQALRQAQLSLLRGESSTAAPTDQRGLGMKCSPLYNALQAAALTQALLIPTTGHPLL